MSLRPRASVFRKNQCKVSRKYIGQRRTTGNAEERSNSERLTPKKVKLVHDPLVIGERFVAAKRIPCTW